MRFVAACSRHPSRDAPNTSRRLALGAGGVCLPGRWNPDVLRSGIVGGWGPVWWFWKYGWLCMKWAAPPEKITYTSWRWGWTSRGVTMIIATPPRGCGEQGNVTRKILVHSILIVARWRPLTEEIDSGHRRPNRKEVRWNTLFFFLGSIMEQGNGTANWYNTLFFQASIDSLCWRCWWRLSKGSRGYASPRTRCVVNGQMAKASNK